MLNIYLPDSLVSFMTSLQGLKRLLFSTLFLLITASVFAQSNSGTVAGKVQDVNGKPIRYTSVAIKGTNIGTTTNESGSFTLTTVPAGARVLVVSGVNHEKVEQEVYVEPGLTHALTITAREKVNTLQQVEITGRKETDYRNEVSYLATKTATPLKDVPQAVSYVTKEVLDDQGAYRLGEAVKNISGVNQFSGYQDYVVRGFRTSSGSSFLINGLRTQGWIWTQPLTVNLERVEVIKGPASALFANTNPGGTINRVTKKPLDESRKAVNFSLGSFNTLRASADFTGPMNEQKTLLYRLNLGYENAETFRDLQPNKTFVIAPSFSFLPNEKTSVNFDLVYTQNNTRLDRGQPIFGATAGTSLTSTPISTSLSHVSDYMKIEELYSTLSINRKLTDKLSINASYMKFAAFEDLFEHRTSNKYATVIDTESEEFKTWDPAKPFGKNASFLVTDPTQMEMRVGDRRRHTYTDNITSYLTYEGNTGTLQHQMLIGADFIQNIQPIGGATRVARNYRTADGRAVTVDKLTKNDLVNSQPVPNVPFVNLTNPQPTIASPGNYIFTGQSYPPSRYYTYGFYVQDQVKYGPLQVLLGLRQELYRDVEGYKTAEEKIVVQQKLLPRLGAVYSLNDNINFYATYTEGFQPQSASRMQNPEIGGPFDPLSSNMLETGAKTKWLNDMLTVNVAAYQIEQNNILVNANAPDNPDLLRQRGQERARGVELDVYGNPLPNLSITANYAYNRIEITKDQEGDPLGLEGRIKENAPLNQAGLWVRYDFSNGLLKGLGLGLGSNYVSERNTFATYTKGADGKELGLTLPAYTILDAAIYYRVEKFRISANLNNILNQTHWVGGYDYVRLYPGTPRNYLISVGYTF